MRRVRLVLVPAALVFAAAAVVFAAAAAVAGCSAKKPEREPAAKMTERERDSTIARSKLPGVTVVGRAMEQADSAAARVARENRDSAPPQ